ncbi:MAG: PilZ domain-containing protein [Planctomycetota bacterium]
MTQTTASSFPKEAIPLPSSAWALIVQQLDEQGGRSMAESPPNRRIYERKRYSKTLRCIVRLKQSAGPAAVYQVHTRNLSAGGVGFFFGGYLHPGTACHLALMDREGRGHVLGGAMRWCRHVAKTLHECGVQFDQPIDVERFLDLATAESD